MENQRTPRRIIERRIYGKKPVGRPKDRWIDTVGMDAKQILGIAAWRRVSLDRSSWLFITSLGLLRNRNYVSFMVR